MIRRLLISGMMAGMALLSASPWTQAIAATAPAGKSAGTATAARGTAPRPAAAARAAAPAAESPRVPEAPLVTVRMETSLGAITLEIDAGHAPLTAGNFLRYVDQKRFDNSNFYRAMKIGGASDLGLVQGGLRGNPKRVLKPIAHEPTSVTGLSHVNGAISMARAEPGTASSDFFIVIGDLRTLDARAADAAAGTEADPGYAVFGRVIDGMDVVHAILEQPVAETAPVEAMKGQMIDKPVTILTVRRAPQPAPTAAPAAAEPPASAVPPAGTG